jgi:hypothetical protein
MLIIFDIKRIAHTFNLSHVSITKTYLNTAIELGVTVFNTKIIDMNIHGAKI